MKDQDRAFLWDLMPDWVRNDEPGLCPAMYGTGSYENDSIIREKVKTLLRTDIKLPPKHWPLHYNACTEPCNTIDGPCCCGAWHMLDDDWIQDNIEKYGLA